MPEMTSEKDVRKNIPFPLVGEEGNHVGHKVRAINYSPDEGIKVLYCISCKRFISYIFAKNKEWNYEKAKAFILEKRNDPYVKYNEISIDQIPEFVRLTAEKGDESVETFEPSSESFILTKEIVDETTGMDTLYEKGSEVDIKEEDGYYISIETDEFVDGTLKSMPVDKQPNVQAVMGKLNGVNHLAIQGYIFKGEDISEDDVADWLKENAVQETPPNVKDITCKNCNKPFGIEIKPEDEHIACPECKATLTLDGDIIKIHNEEPDIEKARGDGQDQGDKAEKDLDSEGLTLVKIDEVKHLVYGVFLWPEKADHHGDVISVDDIEKVAHKFMADYRDIDEMHDSEVIKADIVESAIAWEDGLEFFDKKLKKGAWFGAIKIYDKDVWDKVKKGIYQGFSVRISGKRETIKKVDNTVEE